MTKHIKRLSAIAAAILIITLSVLPTIAAPTGTYVENNSIITEYKRLFHGSIRSTWATYDDKSVLLPVDIQDTWNNPPTTPAETDSLQGTWVFNDTLVMPSDAIIVELDFLSNETQYHRMVVYDSVTSATGILFVPVGSSFAGTLVYAIEGWIEVAFQTVTITTTYSELLVTNAEEADDYLAWLQANATKQAADTVGFPNAPSNSMATPFTNITLDGITVPTYICEWSTDYPEEQRFIFNLTDLILPSGLYTDLNLMIWSGQFFGQKNTRAAEIRVTDMTTEAIYAEWRGTLYFYDSTGIISIVREVEEATRFNEQFIFNDSTLAGSNTVPADYDYWSFEGDVSFTIDSEITGTETLRMYFDGVENSYYYSDGSLENATSTNPVNAFYNAIALGGTGSGGTGTLTIYENGLYNVSSYAYVQASIPQEVTNAELPNLFAFLGDAISGFFAVEIFPGFSIGGIIVFAAGVAMLFFILKVFMGG